MLVFCATAREAVSALGAVNTKTFRSALYAICLNMKRLNMNHGKCCPPTHAHRWYYLETSLCRLARTNECYIVSSAAVALACRSSVQLYLR